EGAERPPPPIVPVLDVDLMILDVDLLLLGHVADREEMDKGGDKRHHQEHDAAEVIDLEANLKREALPCIAWCQPNPVDVAGPVRLQLLDLLLGPVQFGG